MRIIESNSLAVLAQDLLEHWPDQELSDLSAVPIVVPSLGVARWLTYRIAAQFSVCAQVDFVYPANFVWSLFARVLPHLSSRSPFDPATLTWRIFHLLRDPKHQGIGEQVAGYLAVTSARDQLGLARRLAQSYSEILAVRPDWAPHWQKGKLLGLEPAVHERWIAGLWQQLALGISAASDLHPRESFFRELKKNSAARELLPQHISLFAVPNMVPMYQGIFEELSSYVDVSVYLFNPSPEFWFDLISERRAAALAAKGQGSFDFEADGHPLLGALGRQIQDNLAIWGLADERRSRPGVDLSSLFVSAQEDSLLTRLQRSIYQAVAIDVDAPIKPGDASVRIHACHSFTRQLEVLHDQLLDAFESTATAGEPLHPSDILVLVPDIDAAAPAIDAVFGAAAPNRLIPYFITGRTDETETPLLAAFFSILSLNRGRFTLNEFAGLMFTPALAARFHLDDTACALIARWLEDTGVHWGQDGAARGRQGVPPVGSHTFAQGLAALLTGYATAEDQPILLGGVIAYDGIEGKEAEIVGTLARLLSELTALDAAVASLRPTGAWIFFLREVIDSFFDRSCDVLGELLRLDEALAQVGRETQNAAFGEAVELAVVIDAIKNTLGQSAPGAIPRGAVTFAPFGPLRQVPYRVICMLELNGDGSFPRNPHRPEFDLLAKQRMPGDRDVLEEDRACFLEALLAAGERLQMSYTARSVKDNAPLPPSGVLEDCIDALCQLVTGGASTLDAAVLIEHPLQAFSRRYFDPQSGLFSYARELLPGASTGREVLPSFFDTPIAPAPSLWRELDVGVLAKVLYDPIRFLLEKRVGLSLRDDSVLLDDDEPIDLAALQLPSLRQRLYGLYESGVRGEDLMAIARALPEAPQGVLGDTALLPQLALCEKFAAVVTAHRPQATTTRTYALQRDGFLITGHLDGLYGGGRFDARLARLRDRELLQLWCAHLVMHLAPGIETSLNVSTLVASDEIARFEALEDAGALLDDLLALYWQALNEPVPLLPNLSSDFAFGGASELMRNQARAKWCGGKSFPGSSKLSERRAYRIVYGEQIEDLPERFDAFATRLYRPMYQHLHTTALGEKLDLDDDSGPTSGQPREYIENDS